MPAKSSRPYLKTGLYAARKALQTFGSRALPSRKTAFGRELREWRDALVADLGGEDAISVQQVSLVEMATTTRLLVSSVDAYLLRLPGGLVDKRRRRLWPVVRERQALVGQLQSILRDLGLERRAKPVPDLTTYLAARAGQPVTRVEQGSDGTTEPARGTQQGEQGARRPEAP